MCVCGGGGSQGIARPNGSIKAPNTTFNSAINSVIRNLSLPFFWVSYFINPLCEFLMFEGY